MFPLGTHEIEYGVSMVPIILLFSVFFLNKEFFKLNYYNTRFFFLMFIVFLVPVLFNVNFLNQFQLIQKIPFLNSTWVQVRWMSIYILPIIIISGFIIENLNINTIQKKYLAIAMIFILLIQNFAKDNSWHINDQKYSIKNAMEFSLKIKSDNIFEIIGPAILMDKFNSPKIINYKNDMFFFSYSPLTCYSGIFGYGLESLNPSCFLFPEENNCLPGDTFKTSEKEKLIKFANYKKFKFKQNKIQIVSNYISIFTFIGCLLYLIYLFITFIYNSRKKY